MPVPKPLPRREGQQWGSDMEQTKKKRFAKGAKIGGGTRSKPRG